MKHKDLVHELEKHGYTLLRNGGEHDIYHNGSKKISVPRHKEINELTAKNILKGLG